MADQPLAPIIIKRIKKGGHGHHGGAWKVAYADFVTAMMAFFLLLWLLNSTTQDKKKAIADYFTPTIGIKDSKGIGMHGGRSPMSKKGVASTDLSAPGMVVGQVKQGPVSEAPNDAVKSNPDAESTASAPPKDDTPPKPEDPEKKAQEAQEAQDNEQFKLSADEIKQSMDENQELKQMRNNVQVEQSTEGLKIDLIDDPKAPMFATGGATLTEAGKKVLDSMANIVAKTPNQITIIGHTDAEGPSSNSHYTNWELSADRANAVRRGLATTQLGMERVAKVVGMADRELLVKEEPNSPRNRRVTIILMRGSYARDPNKVTQTGRSILSVDTKLKPQEAEPAPAAPAPAKPSIFDQK